MRSSLPPALARELVGTVACREPAPSETRAKSLPLSLRAGGVPRSQEIRDPERAASRGEGARILAEAFAEEGMGSPSVAHCLHLGTDKEADQALSGMKKISAGESAFMPPPAVGYRFVIKLFGELTRRTPPAALPKFVTGGVLDILEDLVARARVSGDTTELRLAAVHIDALRVLLCK